MRLSLPTDPSLRRKILIFTSVGVASMLVVGSIYALSGNTDSKEAKPAIVYELAPGDIHTVRAQALKRTLRVSGSLAPARHTIVKSHSVGTIREMLVNEGDRVRKGGLIAKVDQRNLMAELDSRTAALRRAQADALLAKKNRDNSETLLERKLISQNAFDQTVAAHDVAVANEQAAQAQVRMAENALQDSEIRAEFDGVVATRHVQSGERVMPDTPLVTLVDLSTMQLEALVPVSDVPAIKVGQSATFKVDGFGEREFAGHVDRINPQTQTGTRSLVLYVTVANADGALKGGMFADGELVLEQTAPLLAIPNAALRSDATGQYVLAVQKDVIARMPVVAGTAFPDSGMTAIEKGLSDSDRVIVAPASTLKPGAQIKMAATL